MKQIPDLVGRLRGLPVVAGLAIVFFVGYGLGNQQSIGYAQDQYGTPEDVREAFAPFWEVYALIQDQYVEEVPIAQLVEGAATGMVDALGDPYSGYMDPELFASLNRDLEGEFEGIGVVIRTLEDSGEIEVVGILKGAPAEGSGIMEGDIFSAVDDIEVTGMNQTELADLVRGPEGTDVRITVRRDDTLIDFIITRARIIVPNVESEILEGDIAYIQLNQFNSQSRLDFDAALNTLKVNERAGLIFDLRDNPGGLLSSAIEVGSAFIEDGTIVYEVFGDGREVDFTANGSFADIQVPIVVLVNESSASASELVAGALQDLELATVVGELTLGKGTVQQWLPLQNQAGVRLTVARWLTPDRRWIHEDGVSPDIVVEYMPTTYDDPADPQIAAALEFLLAEAASVAP
ncbi:MAG: S41 family peptidase [Chloroflexota bacterium]|nr:S41 family peptidase [Chloroflexota bacterium]